MNNCSQFGARTFSLKKRYTAVTLNNAGKYQNWSSNLGL